MSGTRKHARCLEIAGNSYHPRDGIDFNAEFLVEVDNEIKLALSKTTQELTQTRADLEKAQNNIIELTAQKKEDENDRQFVSKLIRDLETRNYLIDQLNEEGSHDIYNSFY